MGGGAHPSDLELVAWADGDLAGEKQAEISVHMDQCPACRRLVAWRPRTRELVLVEDPESHGGS